MNDFHNNLYNYIKEGKIDEAILYMTNNIPNNLCKFYSLSNDKVENDKKFNTLNNNSNWLDLSSKQNDPLEMRFAYIKENSSYPELTLLQKDMLEKLRENFIFCSFTDSDYKNMPMWAYYANNHQGYCINYKINKKILFQKILYEDERFGFSTLIARYMYEVITCDENRVETNYLKQIRYFLMIIQNMKHSSWSHEQEYRIVMPSNVAKTIPNSLLGVEIQDITVGLKCSSENIKRIYEISKNLNIPCYKLQTNDQYFFDRISITQ